MPPRVNKWILADCGRVLKQGAWAEHIPERVRLYAVFDDRPDQSEWVDLPSFEAGGQIGDCPGRCPRLRSVHPRPGPRLA